MKRIPKMYNSEEQEVVLKLSTRCTKKGDLFFMVSFGDDYACFNHLSSAMDYIQSNFKED